MPTEEQYNQIVRFKNYFPFRIAYGALSPDGTEFFASAVPNKRIPNKYARDGWKVWVL